MASIWDGTTPKGRRLPATHLGLRRPRGHPQPASRRSTRLAETLIGAMRARWPTVRSNKAITSSCVMSGSSFSDIRRILAGNKHAPSHERRIWRYLLGDPPRKPLFRPIRHFEAAAPTCQRQRSYEAVAVPVLEAALHPTLAVARYDFEHPEVIRCRQTASDMGCQMASVASEITLPQQHYEVGEKE